MTDHFDMIIVGAGVSGIGAAVHMRDKCPSKSICILESREAAGGTWDLFRYPGIRSDSDMHTFGYKFKPWVNAKSIADGPSILSYLSETIDEHDLRKDIRFGHKVIAAHWSTPDALWRVETQSGQKLTCNFLFMCAGYYSYEEPHNPELAGEKNFKGEVVHPQHWRDDIEYKDKRVVIIGSGATAVTLLPSMAQDAAHVTMLQRSPTYIAAQPGKDRIANFLRAIMPNKWAYALTRYKNELFQSYIYKASMKNPEKIKQLLLDKVQKELGDDWNIDPDFIPSYFPWEQRLCLSPDGDFFEALRSGKASVTTDHIEQITETGITLKSGKTLPCDLIVKATGINVVTMGQSAFTVDGEPVDFSKKFTYEAMMYSDVPNMASVFGYINASWTLRADLIAEYVCRIVNHMDAKSLRQATPRAPEGMEGHPWLTIFDPGYIKRVLPEMPMQGDRDPWLNEQNYRRDKKVLPSKPIDDGHMIFSNPTAAPKISEAAE
ncbi:MAG: flavin-containing monooxygenase [Maricaulaceae bacterium]